MIYAGVDMGSLTTKAVLMEDSEIISSSLVFTGYKSGEAGRNVLMEALYKIGKDISDVSRLVTTGYGRARMEEADRSFTEIICHARGANSLHKGVRTVIDIGGQDSKAISLDESGNVISFNMNEKCAAGTGRFLEVMARALETDLDAFGPISISAEKSVGISSTCTVFAESEVISHIAKGVPREEIVSGLHDAIAARTISMAARVGFKPIIMMTGGVAHNIGVVKALEKRLEMSVVVDKNAQFAGCIGAAILASEL